MQASETTVEVDLATCRLQPAASQPAAASKTRGSHTALARSFSCSYPDSHLGGRSNRHFFIDPVALGSLKDTHLLLRFRLQTITSMPTQSAGPGMHALRTASSAMEACHSPHWAVSQSLFAGLSGFDLEHRSVHPHAVRLLHDSLLYIRASAFPEPAPV